MGEYAEMEIERQMREMAGLPDDDDRDPAPARTAFADLDLQAFARDMGLRLSAPSPHHLQIRQDGKVFAEWWPSKGTTRMDGANGPKCRSVAALIRWLKSV